MVEINTKAFMECDEVILENDWENKCRKQR